MQTEEILLPKVYQHNQNVLEELRNGLHKSGHEWLLCLGAGVSKSVGLPNWFEFLAKLTARLLPLEFNFDMKNLQTNWQGVAPELLQYIKAYNEDIDDFQKSLEWSEEFVDKFEKALNGDNSNLFRQINVLEAAEYIRNFIELLVRASSDEMKTEDEIQKCINNYMNAFIKDAYTKDIDMTDPAIKEETLGAIGELMYDSRIPIHNAITYNYDNLLECYLREKCAKEEEKEGEKEGEKEEGKRCRSDWIHSIIKSDQLRSFSEDEGWNIFHVHGRIPVAPGDEMSESVILTESDYYEEERKNYSWMNIVQSYAIASENMIFVGFSGTDYNFRRIIKYVNQDNMKPHKRYIFFSLDDIVKAVFSETADIDNAIAEMKEGKKYAFERWMINHLVQSQTLYWGKHGLNVIWSTIDEIAQVLNDLRNAPS